MRWVLWNGRNELPKSVSRELERIIRCVLGVTGVTRRYRRHRGLPPRALDDRGRGRGGERDPGGRDRREVRPAREAHRRAPTSTSATCRSRPPRACSRSRGIDPGEIDCRHVLRLDVEGLHGLAGGAVDRAPDRRTQRLRGRVRQRLVRDAGRTADGARHAPRRGRAAERPRRRRLPRVVPPRLCERALALHVQLRRRRGRRPAGEGRAERAARVLRRDRRLVLAPGEGQLRRQRRLPRRRALPRRHRPRLDEEGPRRRQPAVLRQGGGGRARALRAPRSRTSPTSAAST